MINKAKEGGEVKDGAANEATMNFEGSSTRAVGESQTKQLLAAPTAYVSMDIIGETTGNQMNTHLKGTLHSFDRTEGIGDVFDERAREGVDRRCEIIRDEYARGDTPIIKPQLEVPYTKKELKRAMRKLKEKYWTSAGLNGIKSWVIDKAGDTFLNFLLESYNKCWEGGETPSGWYETLISYIYKDKGKFRSLLLTDLLHSLVCWLTHLRLCGCRDWCQWLVNTWATAREGLGLALALG